PLVLCYLEGRTRDEAARQLGWSLDVLRGRLERGRTALRRRLVRRGLALSAALLAEAVIPPTAPAPAPVALVLAILKPARTIAAGHGAAAGLSASVAELLQRGSPGMLTAKKKTVVVLLLTTCFAGAAGYTTYRSWPGSPEVAWSESLTPEVMASPEMVEVSGKVLTPDGRPAAGAHVDLVNLHDASWNEGPPLAVTNEDGTFVGRIPKGELARHLVVDRPVHRVASAAGCGLGGRRAFDFLPETEQNQAGLWHRLSGTRRDATLRLVKDDTPLTGRIESAAGKPAAGVTVCLEAVWANEKNDLSAW